MCLDKPWHPECFNCIECNKDFIKECQFVVNNGQPVCIGCNDRSSRNYQHKKEKRKPFNPQKQSCTACSKILKQNDSIIIALNRPYHKECFKCSQCSQTLNTKSFTSMGNVPLCHPCADNQISNKCSKCNTIITGNVVVALKKSWHPNCLKCIFCNQAIINLERIYHRENNQPCCPRCVKTVFTTKFRPLSERYYPPKQFSASLPLSEILAEKRGMDAFLQFLVSEFSIEPLLFYMDCIQFKEVYLTKKDISIYSKQIFRKYLQRDAELEVPISFKIKQALYRSMDNPSRDMFDQAIEETLDLMQKNFFAKFVASVQFAVLTSPESEKEKLSRRVTRKTV